MTGCYYVPSNYNTKNYIILSHSSVKYEEPTVGIDPPTLIAPPSGTTLQVGFDYTTLYADGIESVTPIPEVYTYFNPYIHLGKY